MSSIIFKEGDYVVYPAHGVGQIVGFEREQISDMTIELLVVCFDKDKMILRLPLPRAKTAGLRHLTSPQEMEKVMQILVGKHKGKRALWSRRAQEYEHKINSGNPAFIAEVVRDLYKTTNKGDQSYSERQIYQSAIDRLARELAVIECIDEAAATKKLEACLNAA